MRNHCENAGEDHYSHFTVSDNPNKFENVKKKKREREREEDQERKQEQDENGIDQAIGSARYGASEADSRIAGTESVVNGTIVGEKGK